MYPLCRFIIFIGNVLACLHYKIHVHNISVSLIFKQGWFVIHRIVSTQKTFSDPVKPQIIGCRETEVMKVLLRPNKYASTH